VSVACSATGLLLTGTAPTPAGSNERFTLAYDLVETEGGTLEAPAPIPMPALDHGPLGPSHIAFGAISAVFAHLFGGLDVVAREAEGYAARSPLRQPIGHVGRIAVRGSRAALSARGGSVRLVSLSDANAPRLLSIVRESAPCCFEAPQVAWQGDVLWVAGGQGRLQAWDLSRPERPVPLHDMALRRGATDLLVAGDRVIVAQGEAGLQIFTTTGGADADVRVWPATPGHSIFGIAMQRDVLWLSEDTGSGGILRSVQVPPHGPLTLLGELPMTVAHDVATVGSLVAIVGGRGALTTHVVVVDASDARAPRAIGDIDLPGAGSGSFATVVGPGREQEEVDPRRVVLLNEGGGGMRVLDLSVPDFPDETAALETPGGALGAVVDGDLVWLADGAGGLVAVHIGDAVARRAWLPWVGGGGS
jgi:hypothetical protein